MCFFAGDIFPSKKATGSQESPSRDVAPTPRNADHASFFTRLAPKNDAS